MNFNNLLEKYNDEVTYHIIAGHTCTSDARIMFDFVLHCII